VRRWLSAIFKSRAGVWNCEIAWLFSCGLNSAERMLTSRLVVKSPALALPSDSSTGHRATDGRGVMLEVELIYCKYNKKSPTRNSFLPRAAPHRHDLQGRRTPPSHLDAVLLRTRPAPKYRPARRLPPSPHHHQEVESLPLSRRIHLDPAP
jgi:hypothetical protein